MRNLLLTLLVAFCTVSVASAQTAWNHAATWNPTVTVSGQQSQGHGIAVDAEGKIWYQPYYASETTQPAWSATPVNTRALYIFNPDGSPASFSPLLYIDYVAGGRDTLGGRTILNATGAKAFDPHTGRGLRADENGDIIVMQYHHLYRLDHKTGQGKNMLIWENGQSGAAPAVATGNGTIFVAPVVPATGRALKMYDKDFQPLGNALDMTRGFSRSFEVSPDANKIYWSGYTNHGVILYERADEFSAFDSTGIVIPGVDTESLTWQPGTGWLWVSSGSANDGPNRLPGVTTNWAVDTWYAFDPAELAVNTVPAAKAMLTWVPRPECAADRTAANCGRPRGLAFSPDGQTAYATTFAVNGEPAIQVFSAMPVAIEKIDASVPDRFVLMPAYPNPFNPTTNINFMLNETGHARLAVYDMTGREVAVLADQTMSAGTYQYSFDATGLTSGVYVYRLTFGGQVANGRLTLVK